MELIVKIDSEKVEKALEELKERMIELGMTKGLSHPETVAASQALDTFMNTYFNGGLTHVHN